MTKIDFKFRVTVESVSLKEDGKVVQVILRDHLQKFPSYESDIYVLGFNLVMKRIPWNSHFASVFVES